MTNEDPARDRPEGLPDWYQDAHNRLNDIACLPDNWDSYHAVPPSADAYAAGRRLIQIAALLAMIKPQHAPGIVPLVDGGIQLEWHENSHNLEVVIERDGTIDLLVDGLDEPWRWNDNVRRQPW